MHLSHNWFRREGFGLKCIYVRRLNIVVLTELHLSPIHEVIALRPSFTHHKAKDDPSKTADKSKDKKDDGKGIHQITTKIKKKESERQATNTQQSQCCSMLNMF